MRCAICSFDKAIPLTPKGELRFKVYNIFC
jgi:hypothetical protein